MTGLGPKPSPHSPRNSPQNGPRPSINRRRAQPLMPWALISQLFGLYVLIGLLLSAPAPPIAIAGLAILGTLLLVIGLNQPIALETVGRKRRGLMGSLSGLMRDLKTGLLAYVGGLMLVVALAIAANHIGSHEQDFGALPSFIGLMVLSLLAIALTAAAALLGDRSGVKLRTLMAPRRSIITIFGTCLAGGGLGALFGLSVLLSAR
ncbi:MAG: hypothetical protein WBC73_21195 [Phormidesmis sp.]